MIRDEWQRFLNRVIWSWQGWAATWRTEKSLRQWVMVNVISAGFAIWLDLLGGERALILSLGLLILAVELMNTALETAIDYVSTDQHPLAKKAKDASSAAVAVTSIAGAVAWIAVVGG